MKVQIPASTAVPNFLIADSLSQNRRNVSLEPLIKRADPPIIKMSSSLSGQDSDSNPSKFRIEVIESKDVPKVLDMLKEFFFKDEPMNGCLGLGECKELEVFASKSIPERCSFKAVDANGQIVGVAINGVVKKPLRGQHHDSVHGASVDCHHEKFRKILSLMEYIDGKFNVFELYPNINSFLDVKIISVNTNYRGFGLAGKLMQHTMEYMRENSLRLMHVLCSSHYSARVCEKMNFKRVFELPFADYVVNGENPIKPAAPHKKVTILVQEIQ